MHNFSGIWLLLCSIFAPPFFVFYYAEYHKRVENHEGAFILITIKKGLEKHEINLKTVYSQ